MVKTGRTLTDEVPYDDLQKYVAWCEITGGDRGGLADEACTEHVVWQRDCMLPSQKNTMSVNKLAVEDEPTRFRASTTDFMGKV